MFWRFGIHNPSALDSLLDREDIELETILEEEDLLQEAKSHNQKLIDYLCKPDILAQLLSYITATDDLEEPKKFKYPFLACEIIACEIPQIVDVIVLEKRQLLEDFWALLDRPTPPRRKVTDPVPSSDNDFTVLDSLQASYFCRVISVLLTKQTAEMVNFIRSDPDNLQKILSHLHASAIMDLLLTLVRLEEIQEGKGMVQWLSQNGLLDDLISRLDPYLDSEEHSIAQQCLCEIIRMSQTSLMESPSIGLNELIVQLKSEKVMKTLVNYMLDARAPNSTSTLINGVTIIIDLIRHNNSDMDSDPMLNTSYGYQAAQILGHPAVSLADMLHVLADRVGDFNTLLIEPKSVTGPIRTTLGEQMPLGFERLKICELFAELLHCSNMSNLNTPENDKLEHIPEEMEEDEADDMQSQGSETLAADVPKGSSDTKVSAPSAHDLPADAKELLKEDTNTAGRDNSNGSNKDDKEDDSVAAESTVADDQSPSTDVDLATPTDQSSRSNDLVIGDYLKTQFVEHKVMPTCIKLFFDFPWNNFLHYVIYDMLHQIFNGRMDKGYNRQLAISVFKDGRLTDKMVEVQKKNDEECAKPNGMRLGYMGHLTFIADEIIKLFEGFPETVVGAIKDDVDLDRWAAYCNEELKQTKERDRLPLGGARPNEGLGTGLSEDEEDDDAMDGTAASQYSRYLAQRGADGHVDEDDEDEAEHWISGRDDYDRDYQQYQNSYDLRNDSETMNDLDNIQDEGDDEEEEEEEFRSDEEVNSK
ncbi:SIT4 phosphatase-associated protein-domain-containing protein [Radiomyces spectabilis]|uniref:SIT4 phosphatase-associated protein-domain-containing protein n=1 Tax=Radiomyces spectabilis TaxID=64574 RepID=UPI002220B8ED|nr:SIT4 phosphatase-associated protein-domain-containing protein [Radiomyces spectabilis]KAI8377499.1 SIT4 phosphatase-associated protein-domain-containing protein [Radiomyces spectabilis]